MNSKRQRKEVIEQNLDDKILVKFQSEDGASTDILHLPLSSTQQQLNTLLNTLLSNEEVLPFSLYVNDSIITTSLFALNFKSEDNIVINYIPEAVFRVRTITRCSTTLTGHQEAVLSLQFSPDGKQLASASGDQTVRVWDLNTETPRHTLKGHTNWVQHCVWSPDCSILVTAGMDNSIRVWDPRKGVELGMMSGHKGPITAMAFEPMHRNINCNRLVSTSKDCTAKVWDVTLRKVLLSMSQHTAAITCVRWDGTIYTGARDKSIKMWNSDTGILIRSLEGHAHWVNSLALSTDFVIRTGPFDHTGPIFKTKGAMFEAATKRYNDFMKDTKETLASASDDFTIIIWNPKESKKPVNRMTGHQQPVNHIAFSPDGLKLASASFDKSIKVWTKDGTFLSTLKGHVGACYQVTFSSDSRKLISASRDSTCKVWDLAKMKLISDLPGHSDEVFTCDWSPSGDLLASGGKDKTLKIWKH